MKHLSEAHSAANQNTLGSVGTLRGPDIMIPMVVVVVVVVVLVAVVGLVEFVLIRPLKPPT